MCLLLLSYKTTPNYKLIIAANRDEFYNRPTALLHNWENHTELFAGKDLKEQGTWLGITKKGRIAAITNYRDMTKIKNDAPTRGKLVTDFLLSEILPEEYSNILIETSDMYNGYNLIYGYIDNLHYFSNISKKPVKLSAGIYGLSNHLLDSPWPKVIKSKREFSKILEEPNPSKNELFELLKDEEIYPDDVLPETGLEKELERMVSPIFTVTEKYGTRSSSVIFVDLEKKADFTEKSYNSKNEEWITSSFSFQIEIKDKVRTIK
jgi:uncharacterized protein with NRDE domain